MRRGLRAWVAAAALAAAFGAALAVFGLRYGKGDVYPAYSSLQPGPSGSAILYEALQALPGRQLSRLTRFDSQADLGLPDPADGAVLRLGEPLGAVGAEGGPQALLAFARSGGQVLVAYGLPWQGPSDFGEGASHDQSATAALSPTAQAEPAAPVGLTSTADPLGMGVSPTASPAAISPVAMPSISGAIAPWAWPTWLPGLKLRHAGIGDQRWARRVGDPGLPQRLPLRGGLGLVLEGPGWSPWYVQDSAVVVASRAYGRGRLVVFADAYPFSNEAQRLQPAGAILLASLGGRRLVAFDERGLGLYESPGLSQLAWRFGLGPLLGLLALLGALWLWQALSPLLPPRDPAQDEAPPSGSGQLAALMRGQAPPKELLQRLLDDWEAGPGRNQPPARLQALRQQAAERLARGEDPLTAYQGLQASLSRRKTHAPRP